jgi:hypothetical protein
MGRGRKGKELPEARLEHIETLERLGRLVVMVAREPAHVCFVRLDAFIQDAADATVVASDEYLDSLDVAA